MRTTLWRGSMMMVGTTTAALHEQASVNCSFIVTRPESFPMSPVTPLASAPALSSTARGRFARWFGFFRSSPGLRLFRRR
jgi:hypothetical protein